MSKENLKPSLGEFGFSIIYMAMNFKNRKLKENIVKPIYNLKYNFYLSLFDYEKYTINRNYFNAGWV